MSNDPDPRRMDRFCEELLPGMLIEVGKVSAPDAAAVASDVRLRAEAVAHLDQATREILAAPFFEDSFTHDPADASPWMKALTTLVVRNSRLEELHSNGPVESGGVKGITTYALAPLSHLFAARRREPVETRCRGDDRRVQDTAEHSIRLPVELAGPSWEIRS